MACKQSIKLSFFFFFTLSKVASSEGRSSHNTCLSKDRKTNPAKLVLMVKMMSPIHRLSREGQGKDWLAADMEKSRDGQLSYCTRYGPVCL